MESAGWSFSWNDKYSFKPNKQLYAGEVRRGSYWGFKASGHGAVSLTFEGNGTFTLDFGNSLSDSGSRVLATLNGKEIASAGGNTLAQSVHVAFKDADQLTVQEAPTGVIVINNMKLNCIGVVSTRKTLNTTTSQQSGRTTARNGFNVSTTTTGIPSSSSATGLTEGELLMAQKLGAAAEQLSLPEEEPLELKQSEERFQQARKALEEKKMQILMQRKHDKHVKQKEVEATKKREDLIRRKQEEAKRRQILEQSHKQGQAKAHAAANDTVAAADLSSAVKKEREGETRLSTPPSAEEERELFLRVLSELGAHKRGAKSGTTTTTTMHKEKNKKQRMALAELERAKRLEEATSKLRKKEQARLKKEEENENEKRGQINQTLLNRTKHEFEKFRKYSNEAKKQEEEAEVVSLYCFALMMPYGYEPALLEAEKREGVGIFGCDEYVVFSNTTEVLSMASPLSHDVVIVKKNLAVAYGGRWGTALNTNVFNTVWMQIVTFGRYRFHDWTVKADPDTVFFPGRLREMLRLVKPMSSVPLVRKEPSEIRCSQCQLVGRKGETCASFVKKLQKQGRSCSKALEEASKPPPQSCGCSCDDLACDVPKEEAMYINNCQWGMHGPLEVLSRRAVAAYVSGLPQCMKMREHPWGEDKFMDKCMRELGVVRADQFHLLSETACGEKPAPCGSADVAFHPFKSIQSYFSCWGFANKYGHGPADPRGSWKNGDGEMGTYFEGIEE